MKKLASSLLAAGSAAALVAAPLPASFKMTKCAASGGRTQPALVRFSRAAEARPLIVVLHTWSAGAANGGKYALPAEKYDFHMISPDFCGSNAVGNPLSMGSDTAVADIVAAVEWMKSKVKVDPERIYLIGGSGGGHMALLMAGRHPELWSAVSAWCPISDLNAWCRHHGSRSYGKQIIDNLKADPRTDPAAAKEAAHRSPITWLAAAKALPLDIATGIHDGHRGSVPISHTLNAFNAVAAEKDRVPDADIELMTKEERAPEGPAPAQDPGYGPRRIHFRRTSGNTRVTIFEGGHDILVDYGFAWLSRHRKGQPADWAPLPPPEAAKSTRLTR